MAGTKTDKRPSQFVQPDPQTPVVTVGEVVEIVEQMIGTIRGDLSPGALQLYGELEDLARFIRSTREELASIGADDIRDHDIPSATDELDAVVGATEEATGKILDSCDVIAEIAGELSPELSARATEAVTNIYEACNFQDITGQRITKVVNTLQQIESKVGQLLGAFGPPTAKPDAEVAKPKSKPAKPDDTRPDADLLNGPQLPTAANSQDDIDAILASFD